MRHFLLVLLLAFAVLAGTISGARADTALGVAFPPDNCSSSQPFMSFNGPATGNNTYCSNGQFILKNALPNCSNGQDVGYDGTNFICKDPFQLPACQSGYFLTSDGKSFTCQPVTAPVCPQGQVLTFVSGTGFTCVDPHQSVPPCNGTNEFLTYSNGTFQCASVIQTALPDCPSGQVLTKINGSIQCVAVGGNYASCTAYCLGGVVGFCVGRQSDEALEGPGNWQPTSVLHGVVTTINNPQSGCTSGWQCDDGTWIPSGCGVGTGGSGGDGVGGDSSSGGSSGGGDGGGD